MSHEAISQLQFTGMPAAVKRKTAWPEAREGWRSKNAKDAESAVENYTVEGNTEDFSRRTREGRPSIRVPEEAVPGIAREGRFLSQHETGTSLGFYDPEGRQETEHDMFGYPHPDSGAKAKEPPIYGYMGKPGDPDEPMVGNYGPVKAVLRPHVLHRTTVTYGDSLGGGLTPVPAVRAANEGVTRHEANTYAGNISYLEAQFHGGLPVSDIDHLEYTLRRMHTPEGQTGRFHGPSTDRPLAEHAETLGKPYRILQEEQYTQPPLAPARDEPRTGMFRSDNFWGAHFGHDMPPLKIGRQFREIERSPGFKSEYWH